MKVKRLNSIIMSMFDLTINSYEKFSTSMDSIVKIILIKFILMNFYFNEMMFLVYF